VGRGTPLALLVTAGERVEGAGVEGVRAIVELRLPVKPVESPQLVHVNPEFLVRIVFNA